MAEKPTDAAGAAAEAETQSPLERRISALADMLEAQAQRQAGAAVEELTATVAAAAPSLLSRLTPRMLICLLFVVGLAAALAVISPQQLPVALYKLSLVTLAGYLGYWLDRWVFPYARPDSFLVAVDWRADAKPAQDRANHAVVPGCEQVYAAAQIRRALIILGAMLAMGLGL